MLPSNVASLRCSPPPPRALSFNTTPSTIIPFSSAPERPRAHAYVSTHTPTHIHSRHLCLGNRAAQLGGAHEDGVRCLFAFSTARKVRCSERSILRNGCVREGRRGRGRGERRSKGEREMMMMMMMMVRESEKIQGGGGERAEGKRERERERERRRSTTFSKSAAVRKARTIRLRGGQEKRRKKAGWKKKAHHMRRPPKLSTPHTHMTHS